MLLCHQKGCTSFLDIRTVDKKIYPTNRAACKALGLLGSDQEWVTTLQEAVVSATAGELRKLFVQLLIFCDVSDPVSLWETFWKDMSDDIPRKLSKTLQIPKIEKNETTLKASVLFEIETILNSHPKSLKDFGLPMPPKRMLTLLENRLLMEERSYNRELLQKEKQILIPRLNQDQKAIFNEIINAVNSNIQKLIFVYGHGGTGKTFLWKAITCALRSEEKIVLVVASSDLLRENDLIKWDKAPINDRRCFEALDRSLRDILNEPDTLFGGKSIMLGGDFRQTLPVKKKSSRIEIIDASITASYLWPSFKTYTLHENMRLTQPGMTETEK
ncbi:DNA helicase [Tanacetum coccineum]